MRHLPNGMIEARLEVGICLPYTPTCFIERCMKSQLFRCDASETIPTNVHRDLYVLPSPANFSLTRPKAGQILPDLVLVMEPRGHQIY